MAVVEPPVIAFRAENAVEDAHVTSTFTSVVGA
jgi:hypothetical protein